MAKTGCAALLGFLLCVQMLLLPEDAQGQGRGQTLWHEDEQRMQLGLKLFPVSIGALESLETALGPDGRLLVLVVYDGPSNSALQAADYFKSAAKVRGHRLQVEVLTAADLDAYTGPHPGGIFIASVGLNPGRLRAWSERQRTLVFSPFDGAVEDGAVVGLHVAERILPIVNLTQAERAGVQFKPYFLEEARYYESFQDIDRRANFLLNFAFFMQWPASAFDSASAPLRYCVLGSPELSSSLKRTLAGEQVAGRPLQLANDQEQIPWRRCHILYLDHRAAESASRVLAEVDGAPVLTVGDTEGMVRAGGILSMVRENGRLHPMINSEAAARAGIQISSKLLRLATLVQASGTGKTR
ncbi:YfiR/HmsC family protein [Allochromatium palmeri]|uniref:DUF4154 domain-containing protein n=1 Tax=Allochromatium palmeri TaxID=231048 RepID=A0A6N8EDX2_9GAMM|nr:YfiR/HmsC family protein [Allochromatium palmeri]MTW20697.1 DUF4154 domain-containing protein [Allochromatium palmeri]